MTRSAYPSTMGARPGSVVPTDIRVLVDDRLRRRGVLYGDGRVVLLGGPMLEALGFREGDDLRDLSFTALWHHKDRTAVSAALRLARREGRSSIGLDLAYLLGRPARCRITFESGDAPDLILVTLDRDSCALEDAPSP